jgi:dienelactone hydrolase
MKQRICCAKRIYRLLIISLGLISMLAIHTPVSAQAMRTRIEANHRVYVPQGKKPFPVVIAIPGCSGVSLNGSETDVGRSGDEGDRLFRRHYPRMAERLQEGGFLVLLVDYLAAEGVLNTCSGEIHPKRVGEYIAAAISFVKTMPVIDSSEIHVIGWSHGGAGVLAWLSNLTDESTEVRSAVAVYPGCEAARTWESSLPLLMILAGSDDIALPGVCDTLVQSLPNHTNVQVLNYPGARHGFDLTEGPEVLSVGDGLTVGRDPRAGSDAWRHIFKFFNRH